MRGNSWPVALMRHRSNGSGVTSRYVTLKQQSFVTQQCCGIHDRSHAPVCGSGRSIDTVATMDAAIIESVISLIAVDMRLLPHQFDYLLRRSKSLP